MNPHIRDLAHPHPGLIPYLQRPIDDDMLWSAEYMKAPSMGGYCHIGGLLTDEGIALLNELPVPEAGKCPEELLATHPVAGPLVETMGRLSLTNRYNELNPPNVKASLRHETGEDIVLGEHQDFLDGHAVVYNWDVNGSLIYIIGGKEITVDSNELIVINGAAELISVEGLLKNNSSRRSYGWATKPHNVIGSGRTSRKRLLVYADGVETTITQLVAA